MNRRDFFAVLGGGVILFNHKHDQQPIGGVFSHGESHGVRGVAARKVSSS